MYFPWENKLHSFFATCISEERKVYFKLNFVSIRSLKFASI